MNRKLVISIIFVLILAIGAFIVFKKTLTNYRQEADNAMLWTGDYDKAVSNYTKLIRWNKDNPGLYYLRGDAFKSKGEYSKALEDFERALELGISDSLQTILRISLVAIRMEDYELAENHLKKLARLSTNNENEFWAANYHLGQIEYKKGNYQNAVNYYNKARSAKPTNLELYHRANAYYALGQIDSAVQDYNESIEFVKRDYVRANPNSTLAKCDTCGFPFGTLEYELLTTTKPGPAMKTLLQKLESEKEKKNNR